MLIQTDSCDPRLHKAAIGMARRCRFIIQAVLREAEWGDADYEFYLVIREGVEQLLADSKGGREVTSGTGNRSG